MATVDTSTEPLGGDLTSIGVDVGGPVKGYHAVSLARDSVVAKVHSCDPAAAARWCIEQNAAVIAVDAPCRWRVDGEPARAAERELARDRISCFSTPTEAKATGHSFYTWMFAGHQLYAALAATHPVWMGEALSKQPSAISSSGPHLSTCPVSLNFHPSTFNRHPVSIETFPQAVACALAGEIVSAHRKHKRLVRLGILQRAGIDTSALKSVDEIDAALCALTAGRFATGDFKAYGDAVGGFIVVPGHASSGKLEALGETSIVPRQSRHLSKILGHLAHLTPAERQQLRVKLDEATNLPEVR